MATLALAAPTSITVSCTGCYEPVEVSLPSLGITMRVPNEHPFLDSDENGRVPAHADGEDYGTQVGFDCLDPDCGEYNLHDLPTG